MFICVCFWFYVCIGDRKEIRRRQKHCKRPGDKFVGRQRFITFKKEKLRDHQRLDGTSQSHVGPLRRMSTLRAVNARNRPSPVLLFYIISIINNDVYGNTNKKLL